MRLAAFVALALAFVAPAVAGTAGSSGVLRGVVTRGPTCSKGRPRPCAPMPDVKLVFLRNGSPVARTTSGDLGTYRIRLSAGTYGIRLPGRRNWLPARARVRRGQVTRVDIAVGAPAGSG
ncbi:MAG TPA: hypothetical protein VH063_19985 [Gaiellaceae bacterium]|nr:hypothetical protein [Gaiellaceae bacterium]